MRRKRTRRKRMKTRGRSLGCSEEAGATLGNRRQQWANGWMDHFSEFDLLICKMMDVDG